MNLDLIVFGEALVDRFPDGDVIGGAPLNVARHLAGLGFAPLLITRLGSDAAALRVLQECQRFGLSRRGIQIDPQHPTGTVQVSESASGQHRFEILPDQAYDYIDAEAALQALPTAGRAPLYFGSLAQRAAANRASLSRLRAACRAPGFLDLNWRDGHVAEAQALELIACANVIKLNDVELQQVLGWCGIEAAPATPPPAGTRWPQIARFMERGVAGRLIVTYGALGYAAFDGEGCCLSAGTAPALDRLIDTVGAGDAFAAIVLAGEFAGWPLDLALQRAAGFAAAICGIRGAAPGSPDFYQDWRERWDLSGPMLKPATQAEDQP